MDRDLFMLSVDKRQSNNEKVKIFYKDLLQLNDKNEMLSVNQLEPIIAADKACKFPWHMMLLTLNDVKLLI